MFWNNLLMYQESALQPKSLLQFSVAVPFLTICNQVDHKSMCTLKMVVSVENHPSVAEEPPIKMTPWPSGLGSNDAPLNFFGSLGPAIK
jgi:hypothetical protein